MPGIGSIDILIVVLGLYWLLVNRPPDTEAA